MVVMYQRLFPDLDVVLCYVEVVHFSTFKFSTVIGHHVSNLASKFFFF